MKQLALSFTVIVLVGCASTAPVPLGLDHPANPDAPEAQRTPIHDTLATDEVTRSAYRILADAARRQKQWEQSGPATDQLMPGMSSAPNDQNKYSPTDNSNQGKSNHEHH
jgi:hypothetical protein